MICSNARDSELAVTHSNYLQKGLRDKDLNCSLTGTEVGAADSFDLIGAVMLCIELRQPTRS